MRNGSAVIPSGMVEAFYLEPVPEKSVLSHPSPEKSEGSGTHTFSVGLRVAHPPNIPGLKRETWGTRDAEERGGVGLSNRAEIGLRCGGLGGDKCHVPFPFPVAARPHVCPLL